jgi:hypothetical protein
MKRFLVLFMLISTVAHAEPLPKTIQCSMKLVFSSMISEEDANSMEPSWESFDVTNNPNGRAILNIGNINYKDGSAEILGEHRLKVGVINAKDRADFVQSTNELIDTLTISKTKTNSGFPAVELITAHMGADHILITQTLTGFCVDYSQSMLR